MPLAHASLQNLERPLCACITVVLILDAESLSKSLSESPSSSPPHCLVDRSGSQPCAGVRALQEAAAERSAAGVLPRPPHCRPPAAQLPVQHGRHAQGHLGGQGCPPHAGWVATEVETCSLGSFVIDVCAGLDWLALFSFFGTGGKGGGGCFVNPLQGNSGCHMWGWLLQLQEQCYPFLPVHGVVFFMPIERYGYQERYVHTNVNAFDCTQVAIQTLQESLHWQLTGRKNILLHQRNKHESVLRLDFQPNAWPAELCHPCVCVTL